MSRRRERRFGSVQVIAIAVLFFAFGGALSAEASIEISIPIRMDLKASIAPRALAKSKLTPISLRASTSLDAEDGSHPPALKEFELKVDRHARLNLGGIPACHSGGRETVRKACREALVGKGAIDIGIQFPETSTQDQHEEVFIYNGGTEKGARTLFLWTEVSIPRPAAIVIPVTIKADRGRFGLKAVGSVPKIAGGSGWINRLELKFHSGIFSAIYPPDGTFDLRESMDFVDGVYLVSSVALPVTSRH